MENTVILYDVKAEHWLEYTRPVEVVSTHEIGEVLPGIRHLEARVDREGLFAAGFIGYEAAPAFDPCLPAKEKQGLPLIWFGLFEEARIIDLPPMESPYCGESLDWTASVTKDAYNRALDGVKECIQRGDTYQVNYTLRLSSPFTSDPFDFFLGLMGNHRREYAAFVDTGEYAICSISPELFFRLDGTHLVSKPMKGTAARGMTLEQDREQKAWLKNSIKNRAENVMIVDMIRNDMGRIAETGTVAVPSLFSVERYPTVLQMTSTVTSKVSASFCDILSALFPCSSITGAPKRRTMEIIEELETTPRGIYTGSIGYLSPGRKSQFNVAIRTVMIDKDQQRAEYGVGGGIVWDSDTREEYEECRIKARVLTRPQKKFSLLETLLFHPGEGYFLYEDHLDRMAGSAIYFDFDFSREEIEEKLLAVAATLRDDGKRVAAGGMPRGAGISRGLSHAAENKGPGYKVRLLLEQGGGITCEAESLPEPSGAKPVMLKIAGSPVNSANPFLHHKTTRREIYTEAKASRPLCDDVVLYNERGEVTETTIANIVVKIGEKLYTPPVTSGLLGGVFRGNLLEKGEVEERVVDLETLCRCDGIFLVNSVRKWRKAVIDLSDVTVSLNN